VKFTWIDAEKANWPVRVMCRTLRVSPSGFYAWRSRPESQRRREDRRLGVLVGASHAASKGRYGSPRVHRDLAAHGTRVSRKRVVRIMKDHGLVGRIRRRFVRTTDSRPGEPVASNVLSRDFGADAPNRRWAGDVTYLRTPQGWLYLAVIIDLYSRAVVGWATSAVNDHRLALRALEQAVLRRRPKPGLVHHTDQGSPYASEPYQKALQANGMVCSMSRRGNCLDNAVAESWFGIFKAELGESFESHHSANRLIFDYIECFYNSTRLDSIRLSTT
jgi:putative transposase